MKPLAVTRAVYLQIFTDVLDEIGDPVGTWMDACCLPESLREDPDLFVPNMQALKFLTIANSRSDISEYAYRCGARVKLSQFTPMTQNAVLAAPTLYRALINYIETVPIEDSALKYWIRSAGPNFIRIASAPKTGNVQNFSSWMQIMGIIEVVRSYVGAGWAPEKMAFMGDFPPGLAANEAFANTEFLTNQKSTWVTIPRNLLPMKPRHACAPAKGRAAQGKINPTIDFVSSLRGVVRSHLAHGTPSILTMAELNCIGVRTLQRGLSAAGTHFSRLVQEERCEIARKLLSDPANRIVDVSLAVGYDDPSHFSRFFRDVYGVSPSEFRVNALAV